MAVKSIATATARPEKTAARRPRSAAVTPSEEQIRQRAYEIFLERGGQPGCEIQDWLEAERQLATSRRRS